MSDPCYITTGPFTHLKEHIEELRFSSAGETERSFTVLLAAFATDDPENKRRQGIAVLDNDNAQIVFDGLQCAGGPHSIATLIRLASFPSLNWVEFSKLCRENKRYQGNIHDIDQRQSIPDDGNALRQKSLGLGVSPDRDQRSALIRDISEDVNSPYNFPVADRDAMTQEICRHLFYVEKNGPKSYLAWDIRMNEGWNRTGRIRGASNISSDQDANWRHTVENDPNVEVVARRRALEPYVSGPVSIFDMKHGICEFKTIGENEGFLIMTKFAGQFMSVTRDVSMQDRLMRFNDAELEALWVCCRALDFDLSRSERRKQMEYQMHLLRLDYERGDTSAFA